MMLLKLDGLFNLRIINTGISALAIFACITILYWLFKKKYNTKRKQHQFRSRMAYLGILIFLVVLTRIWIDGFTHIFTMLSLVAAGLVVTNKETIMNFAGWLIINWRGVFSEGDFLQIQGLTGCVDSVRTFHFILRESITLDAGTFTGRVIKVPNGLIITTPFILFSPERHAILKNISYQVPMDGDALKILDQLTIYSKQIWSERYKDSKHFLQTINVSKGGTDKNNGSFEPSCKITLVQDKPTTVRLSVHYYCHPNDVNYFEEILTKKIVELSSEVTVK